jgi:flagellar biosynthesis protein FlhG
MLTDQAQALRQWMMSAGEKRARTVAVCSGKGGVGKSNVAVNLAIRLATMAQRVVLVDADLGTANADVLCNVTPAGTLAHVIAGRLSLQQTMIEAPGGFQLIPGASGLAQVAGLSEFERARLVQQVQNLEAEADIILIDTAAGVGPNVLSFAAAADQLLVVTTPEPPAMTDAYAVIKTLSRRRDDLDVRVLVNMVRDGDEGRAVFARLDAVCRRFLDLVPRYAGHVVSDPKVTQAVRRRKPFVLDSPNCPASLCIHQLAHRMDRGVTEPRGEGLLRRMAMWLAS